MTVKRAMNITNARARAKMARAKGFKATVFRVKGGKARISVTRNVK